MEKFSMITDFVPAGDQPQAISNLVKGLEKGKEHQVLLGVTGSGENLHHCQRHLLHAAAGASYRP